MPIQGSNFAWCLIALGLGPAFSQSVPPQPPEKPPENNNEPMARFGTSVVISTGLRGDIYFIPPQSLKLPKFEKLTPVGTIYTSELNVPRHDFTIGFPGVTGRFEWFAIDYTGKLWIEKPGKYTWALLSDDGSKLYIDGHEVIDNDGQHAPKGIAGTCKLKQGEHRIRISYFQGPRTQVALILAVIPPGDDEFSLFNTEDYLSPEAQAEVRKSKGEDPQTPPEPKPRRMPGEDFVLAPTIPNH
jgi:hypothetical protein